MPPTPIPTLTKLIGTNIRQLRAEHGWTGNDLASRMRSAGLPDWTTNTVAQVETGRQRVDHLADLAVLCEVFELSLPELLFGGGDVLLGKNGPARPLRDIRLAVAGQGETMPEVDDEIAAEYDIERIVRLAEPMGIEYQNQLSVISRLLWGQRSFLAVRDERAGILVRPGTRANISARRGHATKVMLAEMAEAIEQAGGVDELIKRGVALAKASADIEDEDES